MKLFTRFFASAAPSSNMTTIFERNRLANTMPGQIGALAAARLGHTLG